MDREDWERFDRFEERMDAIEERLGIREARCASCEEDMLG